MRYLIGKALGYVSAWVEASQERYNVHSSLVRMSNRELRDMGISRSDIDRIAKNTYKDRVTNS